MSMRRPFATINKQGRAGTGSRGLVSDNYRRLFHKNHILATKKLRARVKTRKSPRLRVFRRRWHYNRRWRRIIFRKLLRKIKTQSKGNPRWRGLPVKSWFGRPVLPSDTLTIDFIPIISLKYTSLYIVCAPNGAAGYGSGSGYGDFLFKSNHHSQVFFTTKRRRPVWRSIVRKLVGKKKKKQPRFMRRKKSRRLFVRDRSMFVRKKKHILRFWVKQRSQQSYNVPCGRNYRLHQPRLQYNYRPVPVNYKPQKNNLLIGTTTRPRGIGRLLKSGSATRHNLLKNIARSFEFENWTFWEEFIATKDHSRDLRKYQTIRLTQGQRKTARGVSTVGITKRTGMFLWNRHTRRHEVTMRYFLSCLIKLFTISKPTWKVLLRLIQNVMGHLLGTKGKLGYTHLYMLKRVFYLITELDYLVSSRIESGILPSYSMERSTLRGYSHVRNRFLVFKRQLRRLIKKNVGGIKVMYPQKVNNHYKLTRSKHSVNGYIIRRLFLKKKKKKNLRRKFSAGRRFIKWSEKLVGAFWSRGSNLRRFMKLPLEKRFVLQTKAWGHYIKRHGWYIFWRKGLKSEVWRRHRRRRMFPRIHKLRRLRGALPNVKPRDIYRLRRPISVIKGRTVIHGTRPKQNHNLYISRVVKKFNRGGGADKSLAEAQLTATKRRIPKFRVKKKLRNIKLRGTLRVISKKYQDVQKMSIFKNTRIGKSLIWRKKKNEYLVLSKKLTRGVTTQLPLCTGLSKPTDSVDSVVGDYGREFSNNCSGNFVTKDAPVGFIIRSKESKRRGSGHTPNKRRYKYKPQKVLRYCTFVKARFREINPHLLTGPQPNSDGKNKVKVLRKKKKILNIKLPSLPNPLLYQTKHKLVGTHLTIDSVGKLKTLVRACTPTYKSRQKKKRSKWLGSLTKASYMHANRSAVGLGLKSINLKLISAIGIKSSFKGVIEELLDSTRVLPFGVRKFFNKSKYVFTILLLITYMDVAVWSSYLNKLFFKTKFFRQRRIFNSLRSLLPRTAISCGMHSSIRGMYMCFKGKVASRGGLRKRTLRSGYGWYSSANFGLQYRYRFKQVWSKSGAIGLKTIITCGNSHINVVR